MTEDKKIFHEIDAFIKRLNRFSNISSALVAMLTMLGAVVYQIIIESNVTNRKPSQLAFLPVLLVPFIVHSVGVFKKPPINNYLKFSFIFQLFLWAILALSYFVIPTYMRTLAFAEPIMSACFVGSIVNFIAVIVNNKVFLKVSLTLNILVYISVIIYSAIVYIAFSTDQNSSVYYSLAYIFFFTSVFFNMKNIDFSKGEDLLNSDIDDYPEIYKTDDELLIDPIKTIYEVFMFKQMTTDEAQKGIEYNIWYDAITEQKYLDYVLEHHLYGEEFMSTMLSDFSKFYEQCDKSIDDESEKLRDFFQAAKLISDCSDESEKQRMTYNLLLMCRADRRFFTKNE